jgi:hypothetical protein
MVPCLRPLSYKLLISRFKFGLNSGLIFLLPGLGVESELDDTRNHPKVR